MRTRIFLVSSQALLLAANLRARFAVLASQNDKRQHVVCSFLIYIFLCVIAPVSVALALTMLIGFIKEVWDKYFGTGFCYYDLLSNCVGVALAVPIGYAIKAMIGI